MFQYAYGYAQATLHNLDLYLDLSYFKRPVSKPNQTLRVYRLDVFEMDVSIVDERDTRFFRNKLGKQLNKINLRRLRRGRRPWWSTLAIGYWQSPKFFTEVEAQLREQFRFKPMQGQRASAWEREINTQTDSVMVHLRYGDYDGHPIHDVCTPDYYHRAIGRMVDKVTDPRFYIFSDDIARARQVIKTSAYTDRLSYVEGCESAVEEMQLMTCCQHHIISNSTFSWWGAWLGKKSGQMVLTPNRWFREEALNKPFMAPDGIIPVGWTQIEV